MAKNTDILFEQNNRCGVVTLNRPKALNAMTYEMFAALDAEYKQWADDPHIYGVIMQSAGGRAFCSGGDIRALYDWWRAGDIATILQLYGTEYQHNWTLDRFLKPHVALIDGIVMGGGVGVSLYGTHRVAGANYRFAMPEVGIGFFPDVGATWFLSRLAGKTGLYLALTGRTIDAADAYSLGLVTHCIAAGHYPAIHEALSEAEPVDALLAGFHQDPGASDIAARRADIDRLFSAASVEEVLGNLDAETGDMEKWAREAAADIRTKSPTGLKVAFQQMQRGPKLQLDEALELEFAIARRFFDGEEFFEGIRAAIIDKDQKPNWSPATLEQVTDEMIEAFFAPLPDSGLELVNPFAR
ncbi:MAG: enoyl-CoA hydratase/isomerase family protein [Hyphomicrobiales bacterium]|nr:enoyl-CoA hydratase/isomerase family protein [Hyphomicrobiales bacterium]